jgi:hypothetical protein
MFKAQVKKINWCMNAATHNNRMQSDQQSFAADARRYALVP